MARRYPAEQVTVTDARHFVVDVLRGWDLDDELVADAELCTAELVTNAVLHAATAIDLTVRRTETGARIEIRDRSLLPVTAIVSTVEPGTAATLSDETMSGRGLLLVEGVATAWGVDYGDDDKTVWFVVGGEPDPPAAPDEARSQGTGGRAGSSSRRAVRLLGLPVALSVASGNNVDDVIREFQLLAIDEGHARGIPDSMIAEVEEALSKSGPGRHASRVAAAAALATGADRYDLDMQVGPQAGAQLARLNALLEDVGDCCRDGALLSLPPTPEVVAFRRWCAAELQAQLDGAAPTPCPW